MNRGFGDHSDAVWLTGPLSRTDPGGPHEMAFATIAESELLESPLARLDRVVAKTPDKIAVTDGAGSLSYAQLRRSIDDLAARILPAVEPGKPIAAVLNNDIAFPVVLIAGIVAGRPLAMINTADPLERQGSIFRETGARALIVANDTSADLSFVPADVELIRFDPRQPRGSGPSITESGDDDPVIIAFTSGSTGRPKGLALSRRAILTLISRYINAARITPDDVVMGLGSLTALGARDALAALLSGATLRLVDVKRVGLGGALEAVREERGSILAFVPSAFRAILQAPGVEAALASLRLVNLVGESAAAADIALFRSKLPAACRISLALGSTEVMDLFNWFVRDEAIEQLTAPVGYLERGRTVAFLDEDGRIVSPEQGGEVVVKDRLVALGAWREGRLDRDTFQTDPEDPLARIHYTGDVLRIRADGLAEFLGRRDRMVKVLGLKADLGEVEAALRGLPSVHDAVAVALDRSGEATIAVFLTPAQGAARPVDAEIRRAVVRNTAPHMTPSTIRWLDDIPRLPSGKADLVVLRDLAARR